MSYKLVIAEKPSVAQVHRKGDWCW